MGIYNLVSVLGLLVLMAIAWALSRQRGRVNVRCVAAGVALQLALGAVVFLAPPSRAVFAWINDLTIEVLAACQAGQAFVFGSLADPEAVGGFSLATQALPLIIFFSALMGLLYYAGIMPAIIRAFAWVFSRAMGISGAESLCAASNIFVGIESVTAVRPYLQRMTRSEFCTILAAGMATVAASTMAVYVSMLSAVLPGIAGHLVSASILSVPAAILMAKILYPEDGQPVTGGTTARFDIEREPGPLEAVIAGAMAGVKLVVGVVALLIAFVGMIGLADLVLGWIHDGLSLAKILGYAFAPLAMVIGVPWADAPLAGQMLGVRMVATEIPAYLRLQAALESGSFTSPRSGMIVAYALCGFAHVASLAIFVGGTAALAPDRRNDIAAVGPRALLAATLACLMTGAVAGTFFVG
ncbi:MAG: nucleoside transporter [Planctomycetes bacterium]|nr:nucleoside transporter [Planctomycetota bacterium]